LMMIIAAKSCMQISIDKLFASSFIRGALDTDGFYYANFIRRARGTLTPTELSLHEMLCSFRVDRTNGHPSYQKQP